MLNALCLSFLPFVVFCFAIKELEVWVVTRKAKIKFTNVLQKMQFHSELTGNDLAGGIIRATTSTQNINLHCNHKS